MTKQDVLKMIEALPEDATDDQISEELERIRFMAEVDAGLAELDRGEKISHEELKRSLSKWLKP